MVKYLKTNPLFSSVFFLTIFCSLFFISNQILAAGVGVTTGDGIKNPLGTTSIIELLQRIIGYLLLIGVPIVVIMVLYGGFLIMFANGEPERVQKGGKTILWAAVGYAIILCSWGVIYIIGEVLGTDIVGKI